MIDPFDQKAPKAAEMKPEECPVLDKPLGVVENKILWIDDRLFFGILIGVVLMEFIRSIARE